MKGLGNFYVDLIKKKLKTPNKYGHYRKYGFFPHCGYMSTGTKNSSSHPERVNSRAKIALGKLRHGLSDADLEMETLLNMNK